MYRSHTQGVMTGIAATGPANAWAVGFLQEGPELQIVNQLFVVHFAMHWNGHRWTTTPSFWNAGNDVVPDGHGGAWLGNFGHWTGRTWIDATNWAAPITGIGSAMLVKIPGTRGSYWGSGGVMVRGSPTGEYPGVMLYGPVP